MEIVDIVDEQNNVLYKTSKEEAHAKGLLHRCVIAEVVNSQGQMALVRPRSHKQDAGQYVSPVGGHVRAGETEEEALRRETLEEVGITVVTFRFVGRAIFNRFVLNRQENHYFALYEVISDDELTLGDEVNNYQKFGKAEIRDLLKEKPEMFGGAFHFVMEHFFHELLG